MKIDISESCSSYLIFLTLKRPTSGRPCQGRGGGLQEPPLSNLALERHRAPKTHFPKSWDHFQFIRAIFQIFFLQNAYQNCKITVIVLFEQKMRKISIFAIFELHQQYIHQKNAFSKWNSIMGRKNMICWKKNEKNWFFPVFDQKLCWPVGFNGKFFANGEKNFKNYFIRTC